MVRGVPAVGRLGPHGRPSRHGRHRAEAGQSEPAAVCPVAGAAGVAGLADKVDALQEQNAALIHGLAASRKAADAWLDTYIADSAQRRKDDQARHDRMLAEVQNDMKGLNDKLSHLIGHAAECIVTDNVTNILRRLQVAVQPAVILKSNQQDYAAATDDALKDTFPSGGIAKEESDQLDVADPTVRARRRGHRAGIIPEVNFASSPVGSVSGGCPEPTAKTRSRPEMPYDPDCPPLTTPESLPGRTGKIPKNMSFPGNAGTASLP